MIDDPLEEIKTYSEAALLGNLACRRKGCPYCNSPPFARHGCRKRTFRVLVGAEVHRVPGYVARFKCPACGRTFTDYPPFAVPHKRYTTPSILDRARRFFQGSGVAYRRAVWVGWQRIVYAPHDGQEDLRQLSHTTLWRWVGWLGGMAFSFTNRHRPITNPVAEPLPSRISRAQSEEVSTEPRVRSLAIAASV